MNNKGLDYYKRGDFSKAFLFFMDMYKKEPENINNMLWISSVLCDKNEINKAFELLNQLYKIQPDNIDLFLCLALISLKNNNQNAYKALHENAIKTFPDDPKLLIFKKLNPAITCLSLMQSLFNIEENLSKQTGKIHVILIQPAEPFGQMADIPLSIIGLAAVLQEGGVSVEILDARLYNLSVSDTIKILTGKKFDIVGITGFNNAYRYIKDFSFEFKRKFPETPLIAGGPFILTQPEIILSRIPIDVSCTGDGEEIILELVQKLVNKEPLDDINNIAYMEGSTLKKTSIKWIEDYDKIPIPAYNLLNMDAYINNMSYNESRWEMYYFPISSGRGCIHHCYYCGRPSRKKVRRQSPERLIEHMDYLNKHYNITGFLFDEDSPFYPREWIIKFCKLLIESERNYNFYVTGCPEQLDEEIVSLLVQAGCVETGASVEHWNPEIQKAFYRGTQSKHIVKAWELFKKYNLKNRDFNILWGHPKDSSKSFKDAYLKAIEMVKKYDVTSFWTVTLVVYQNSKLQKDAMRKKKIVDFEDYMYSNGGYGPYVNLTSENDDVFRSVIVEVKLVSNLEMMTTAYNNAIMNQMPIEFCNSLRDQIINLTDTLLKLKQYLSLPEEKRNSLQFPFDIPLYDPEKDYYKSISCFEEILDLKPETRFLVYEPDLFNGDSIARLFNSERVSKTNIVAFVVDKPQKESFEGKKLISINDIHLFDAEYMLISENYRNDFILNKINHKIKVIWLSNNSLQQKRWAVPSLVAGYYNMKYWDVDLKDGKISRKKLS